jgi:hypothetical protein
VLLTLTVLSGLSTSVSASPATHDLLALVSCTAAASFPQHDHALGLHGGLSLASCSSPDHVLGLNGCHSLACSSLMRPTQLPQPHLLLTLAVYTADSSAPSARVVPALVCSTRCVILAVHSCLRPACCSLSVTVSTAASFSPCPDHVLGLHRSLRLACCSLPRSARRPQPRLLPMS